MSGDLEPRSYGWKDADAPHSAAYLHDAVVQALRRAGSRRVLDLGCGNGALCGALSEAGFDVVGMDADARGVAIARAAWPGVRFHQGSLDGDPRVLAGTEGSFDAVVATEVIEHLFVPGQLPRFAAPLLRRGGRLILTTPYHGYLKNLALSLTDRWDHHHTALWDGGHIKFFSRRTLTALLAAHGFDVAWFGGVGRAPWLWKSMVVVATPTGAP